jgi:hypothetical protein
MDFEQRIREIERDIKEASDKQALLRSDFKEAKVFTNEFLSKCGDAGLTKVCVNRSHESIPRSKSFPHGPQGSVFAIGPSSVMKKAERPLIWGVVDEMGIGRSCGNKDQYEIKESALLIDGTYHLIKGKWKRIDKDI